uniref:ES1 protein, mitochondrial-like n=1 Tax=Sinocyclocheilus rhinocerous TaxID=307959 RepID=A0A673LZG1_9TELE
MLASRAHLAKQAAAMLVRQPACLMHHGGDWGNWGNTNVAVVFSGCGWWDGTDIHEAAYTMYHLSRNGARFQIFAPNQQQMHVMDHMKMQPSSSDNRNVMMESARFSHGQGMMQMNDLSKLDVNSFDAVIFPGGHGVVMDETNPRHPQDPESRHQTRSQQHYVRAAEESAGRAQTTSRESGELLTLLCSEGYAVCHCAIVSAD